MKYHYQKGVVEKDKKGHKKLWLGFFSVIGVVTYGGFIFANLALNGWPLQPVDATAKIVKTTKPGGLGNHLFIPVINVSVAIDSSLKQSGNPASSAVKLVGGQLGFGLTPDSLRAASPFFNLDKLRSGDEIFLDSKGTRYVYRIVDSSQSKNKLTLQTKNKRLVAESVGTVAWNNGLSQIQAF